MKKVTIDDLDLNPLDGLYYNKFEYISYTGDAEGKEQGKFKNGVKVGSWVFYDNNGKLLTKGDFKNVRKKVLGRITTIMNSCRKKVNLRIVIKKIFGRVTGKMDSYITKVNSRTVRKKVLGFSTTIMDR